MKAPRQIGRGGIVALALLAGAMVGGCSTMSHISDARQQLYAGRPAEAAETLKDVSPSSKDAILFLMERGTARQAAGDYDGSSKDFIEAADRIEKLVSLSITKDSASMVVNDSLQDYRGAPFERTLLHAFTAKNHFAVGNFENAAVEARRMLAASEAAKKKGYPDDAYSHFISGFALQMMDDPSNASLEFRKAAEISSDADIDDQTGQIFEKGKKPADSKPYTHELVCFVLVGRSPSGRDLLNQSIRRSTPRLYAEIRDGDKLLGRSYTLADTVDIAFTTEQKDAAAKLVKTVARIAAKEAIAYQIESDNEALGELIRFVLIGLLEQPDVRRWETLPRWLQVARVPCPADLASFTVVLKNEQGNTVRTISVTQPIQQRRDTKVSFVRDLGPLPLTATNTEN